ncbi:MAG: metallophosphoesterase [Bacteroidota bacterium]
MTGSPSFWLFLAASTALLVGLDYYVYRNWKVFVALRSRRLGRPSRLRLSLPLYRVFMALMPLTLPLSFYLWRWWEVEPKAVRAALIGLWLAYYLPKALVALGLLIKDGARFVVWLFGWFQEQLASPPTDPPAAEPASPASLDLSDMKRMRRREFLQQMGWTAASVPFVVVGYSVFRTLYDFAVMRVDVPIAGLPRQLDGLTIAQLSDLHAGSFFSPRPMEEVVHLVNGLRPDVVAITGDFVNRDAAELPTILPALADLQAELSVVGCLGNHDHYAQVQEVARGIQGTGVDLLINQHQALDIDGAQLYLIGTDNTGFRQHYANLPAAMQGIPAEPTGRDARILLAHDPTFWDHHVRPQRPDIDLMLCGHTHGGQIGFEMGPVRWGLARVAYARWAGLYSERRLDHTSLHHLYVNRGTGTVGPPLRLGIRPEITLLTLRAA